MKIIKLYGTTIANPYMVAEFEDGSFRSIRLDPSCSFFVVGLPIEKMGVRKSMLLPISSGEMRMVYQQHVDDYNRKHGDTAATFKELRRASGMTQREFAMYFGIPARTVEDWDAGARACAPYLLQLMEYKLQNEGIIQNKITPEE